LPIIVKGRLITKFWLGTFRPGATCYMLFYSKQPITIRCSYLIKHTSSGTLQFGWHWEGACPNVVRHSIEPATAWSRIIGIAGAEAASKYTDFEFCVLEYKPRVRSRSMQTPIIWSYMEFLIVSCTVQAYGASNTVRKLTVPTAFLIFSCPCLRRS
jgi:hypothetical protein